MTIADQIDQVRQKISKICVDCNRSASRVLLLAVSKTHPASAIQEAYREGITEFAESYLSEALEKIFACQSLPICWHFIGPLQSNKTRLIAENFDWVQSVDRIKILQRLNDQRPKHLAPLNVCIQANLFNEAQKQGATLELLPQLLLLAQQLPNIKLRGLMVIPPKQAKLELQQAQFIKVADIYAKLQKDFPQMDILSMGMSGDMPAAIAAGSNMLRIGTAIFGARGNMT